MAKHKAIYGEGGGANVMAHQQHSNCAFTLIELSVVLVIIGLIVGGVLVGRDMVKQAQSRQVVSNIERYKTAIKTFRTKFDCVPGDCGKATQFLTDSTNAIVNGNDNLSLDTGGEVPEFWHQLSVAKLINGYFSGVALDGNALNPGLNVPMDSNNKSYVFRSVPSVPLNLTMWQQSGSWYFVGGRTVGASTTSGPGFSVQEARALDIKYDDGHANTGVVLGARGTISLGALMSDCTTVDAYIGGTSIGDYKPDNAIQECILLFSDPL